MPPKVRITKEMVTDASVEIIRKNGHESLKARTIAEYLNCSTQPVMYNYKTVDEIREAAYAVADSYHTSFIMPKETDGNPMLALGLNYVRFGYGSIWMLLVLAAFAAGMTALVKRNCRSLGVFHCKGFDTFGPFKLIGGINKHHPDEDEIKQAVRFYEGLKK